jgi:hypothetical protein
MASSQIQGFTTANIAEVEAATKALRATLRSEDYGALGVYSLGGVSGIMAAGLAANAPIFSLRWTQASNLMLIKRVTLSAAGDTVAFTAGAAKFDLLVARSYSATDTGGTSILPTGNQNKMRASTMGTTLLADARQSATATLTAGTRTLDTNPIGSVCLQALAIAGSKMLDPFAIFDQRPGEYPLVLAQNEGLVLQTTVPATGTWKFAIKIDWTEISAWY